MNRPIPTQPVNNKKSDERHPALLPVIAILAGIAGVAAYLFVEDNYFKPHREAQEAQRASKSQDPMYVPVDQFMDTMSIQALDFSSPATLSLITSDKDEPLDREILAMGAPRQPKAVRELAIRREVPPYEEQITVWFVPERTPVEVLPRYYRLILARGFFPPVSYNPGSFIRPSEPLQSQASDQVDGAPPQPPPPIADVSDGPGSAATAPADMPLPQPEIVETAVSEDDPATTQPRLGYNLQFSRRANEGPNAAGGPINPYRAQSEVLILRLIPVNGGTRMVTWLRTPLKERASKRNEGKPANADPQTRPSLQPTTKPR